METTLGGDRLGSGNKQNVHLKNFNRSTHDLSYLWRSSMAPGVLTPFMAIPALRGDSFDIKLNFDGKTLPTVGPLFGSYKVQLDVFQCPIRLYQGKLHMNKLGIGLEMDTIKLPQIVIEAASPADGDIDSNNQIEPSTILSHLNIRGLGKAPTAGATVTRKFNGVSYLGLWDIYKNYYANKQEGIGYVIHNPMISSAAPSKTIITAYVTDSVTTKNVLGTTPIGVVLETGEGSMQIGFSSEVGIPNPDLIGVEIDGSYYPASGLWNTKEWNKNNSNAWVFTGWMGLNANVMNVTAQEVPTIPFDAEGVYATEFPLENIDKMREEILMHVQEPTAFEITKNSIIPYGLPLQVGNTPNSYCKLSPLEGLPLKTYQSDLFNNWIKTEWIDGTNGISAVTAVDTSSGNFTIDQLNIAQKVYNMLNRIATAGGSYNDWLNAVYEENNSGLCESPIYLGGLSKELVFQEVISNANAQFGLENEQPLGTLAGRGVMSGKHKGGVVKVRVTEPSYLIGIVSITPRICYSSGNEWDTNLETMDDFHKPNLSEIGFQDLITDQMHWGDTNIDPTTGEKTFKSAGKVPAWINYMTNTDKIRGDFATEAEKFMVLDRRYECDTTIGIKDLTTYIDPSKFNNIFADTKLNAQNFWAQISVDIEARRIMSAKLIPNL